jgi:hypothetical protein
MLILGLLGLAFFWAVTQKLLINQPNAGFQAGRLEPAVPTAEHDLARPDPAAKQSGDSIDSLAALYKATLRSDRRLGGLRQIDKTQQDVSKLEQFLEDRELAPSSRRHPSP